MRTTTIIALLAAIIAPALLASCQSAAGPTEEERERLKELQANDGPYRATAQRFVRHAQRGDSAAMVTMTSPDTIRLRGGEHAVRSMIEDGVLPSFANATVEWSQQTSWGLASTDRTTGLWIYGTSRQGGTDQRFRVFVLRQDGRMVVGRIENV